MLPKLPDSDGNNLAFKVPIGTIHIRTVQAGSERQVSGAWKEDGNIPMYIHGSLMSVSIAPSRRKCFRISYRENEHYIVRGGSHSQDGPIYKIVRAKKTCCVSAASNGQTVR